MTERACGTCTLCCKVLAITALDKPMGRWCPNCAVGRGCAIYDARPEECRTFHCLWLVRDSLGPEWKPERAKFVIAGSADRGALLIHVDPGSPAAWRREPYHATLRAWSRAAAAEKRFVLAMVGEQATAILPDRDVVLGPVRPGDRVTMRRALVGGRETLEPFVERPV